MRSDHGLASPRNNEAPAVDAAQGFQERTLNDVDFATGEHADKRFATLAAQYALAGHALIRSQPGEGTAPYYATRWGLVRPLDDLDAAEAFLRRAGGAS